MNFCRQNFPVLHSFIQSFPSTLVLWNNHSRSHYQTLHSQRSYYTISISSQSLPHHFKSNLIFTCSLSISKLSHSYFDFILPNQASSEIVTSQNTAKAAHVECYSLLYPYIDPQNTPFMSFRAQPWGDWLASIHEVFCCPALWWTLLVLFSLSSKVAHFFPATFSDGQCPLSHHPLSGMGLQVPASFCSFSSLVFCSFLPPYAHQLPTLGWMVSPSAPICFFLRYFLLLSILGIVACRFRTIRIKYV